MVFILDLPPTKVDSSHDSLIDRLAECMNEECRLILMTSTLSLNQGTNVFWDHCLAY